MEHDACVASETRHTVSMTAATLALLPDGWFARKVAPNSVVDTSKVIRRIAGDAKAQAR